MELWSVSNLQIKEDLMYIEYSRLAKERDENQKVLKQLYIVKEINQHHKKLDVYQKVLKQIYNNC